MGKDRNEEEERIEFSLDYLDFPPPDFDNNPSKEEVENWLESVAKVAPRIRKKIQEIFGKPPQKTN